MGERTVAGDNRAERRRGPSRMRAWLAALVLWVVAAAGAPALAGEAGLPFIHNFDPTEYGGSPQNWSLAQDRQGVIYVGNVEDGVLAFDGTRWKRIPVPDRVAVRSLALGRDGRMYVGTVGNLGYLQPDASGQLAFVSLLDRIPPAERHFSDVWNIHPTADGVYFATLTHLFRYRGGRMEVWKPQSSFHLSFLVDGTLYVREVGRGLMRMIHGRLELVPGSERLAGEKIYALLPWHGTGARPGDLLVGTRTQGWFIYDGRTFRRWATDADAQILQGALYGALWLADGRLAVATLRGGLFLLDAQGHLLRSLTRASGLSTDVVLALFQDSQHGLWVASGNGVTRINVDSPLTHFGELGGLHGSILALQRHAGRLYVGTTEGLFRLSGGGDASFQQVPQVPGQSWSFAEAGSHLLVANNEGVFALEGDAPRRVLATEQTAFSLLPSRRQPGRVFVGLQNGLASMRLDQGGRWIDEGRIEAVSDEVRTLVEDGRQLWLGTWSAGVKRLTFPAGWRGPRAGSEQVTLESFGAAQGLPAGQTQVVAIGGKARFLTSEGIYRFDPAVARFSPDPAFAGLFPGGPRQVSALRQDRRGQIWMYTADLRSGIKETGRAVREGQHWRWQVTPLQPISGIGMSALYDDAGGTVWLGGDQGLFRYEPTHAPPDGQFHALLRKVAAHDGHLLFAGHPLAGTPQIPYAQNALRFEFAAPSYDDFAANRFQVLLQGVDRGWSPWSDDAYRDYTNIPEGEYRFRVRARNVYGEEGREATFDFRVLPPWYRTAWAWTLWIVSGLLAPGLFLHWRSKTLRRRNRELTALVDQRTAELARANLALVDANEALAQQTITDPLTGLKNRRYLNDHVEHDLAAARRQCKDLRTGQPGRLPNARLLFLMVDIDHFKEINDSYGHAAGDRVLVQLSGILRGAVRESDTPVRWGGEEFLIVARFAPPDAGPQFAERIRAAVAAHPFDLGDGRTLHRTCSIGFASYPFFAGEPAKVNWEHVVNLADECLYAAKRHGRNAWAGTAPTDLPLPGDVIDALHASFSRMPEPGPLRLLTSWSGQAPA